MTGSVIDRGDGKWLLKWDAPRKPGEKRRQLYKVVRAEGIKEAKKLLRAEVGATIVDLGEQRRQRKRYLAASWMPTAYTAHHEYETLHPFMDGNGRSGRVLWLWMMGGIEHAPLGFLHHWYYQSLSEGRSTPPHGGA